MVVVFLFQTVLCICFQLILANVVANERVLLK